MEHDHSKVDEIKAKIDIVTLVGQYVQLKRAGQNYKGLCPFHGEKTPSFMVSPKIGIFKCFGCDEGGDIFNFVEKVEGVDFLTALKILGDKAGVSVEVSKNQADKQDISQIYYDLNQKAADFYHDLLVNSPVGKQVLEFLVNGRKISIKSINEFKLGLAPASGIELEKWVTQNKLDKNLLVKLNLLAFRSGRFYDWFRARIMFPIFSSRGKVVGFSGRILGEGEPKYLNSPESPIFNKSKTLFGLNLAKTEIKKKDFGLIVEGNFDVVSSFQAGVRNTVAPLGTAATEYQVAEIKKWSNNLYIGFDNDSAGFSATNKLAQIAFEYDCNIKIVVPEGGKDPDEAVKASPAAWVKSVDEAVAYYDFLISRAAQKLDLSSAEGKRKFSQAIFPLIAKVRNPLEKNHYVKKIASLVDEPEMSISRLIGSQGQSQNLVAKSLSSPKIPQASLEEYLLALVFELGKVPAAVEPELFTNPLLQRIVTNLPKDKTFNVKSVRDSLEEDLKETVDNILLIEIRDETVLDTDKVSHEVDSLVRRLKETKLRSQLKSLILGIKQAEVANQANELETLQKQFMEVSNALKNIEE